MENMVSIHWKLKSISVFYFSKYLYLFSALFRNKFDRNRTHTMKYLNAEYINLVLTVAEKCLAVSFIKACARILIVL